MNQNHSTTPFGRRPLTLAQVATQAAAKTRPTDKIVHKWNVFRDICTAKGDLGVSERSLAVLDALLSFHPETALTGESLTVFPSNNHLALRAHGMAPATLRRHLAALVDAGIIIRRDSPNGKRYARKGTDGEIEKAFGFDLSPVVVRAEEFAELAEAVRAGDRALRFARERITLCRRDIAKMIAVGLEESVPGVDWLAMHDRFRALIGGIRRAADLEELERADDALAGQAVELTILLEDHVNLQNISANESQNEQHKQNSNTNPPIESEPGLPISRAAPSQPTETAAASPNLFPLRMILDACPDLHDYAKSGIGSWRDLLATVATIRPMLGISPSAWQEALEVMGENQAAVVVAAILQRAEAIASPGGYLRDLTRRARAGEFSSGPMIMALLSGRRKATKMRA